MFRERPPRLPISKPRRKKARELPNGVFEKMNRPGLYVAVIELERQLGEKRKRKILYGSDPHELATRAKDERLRIERGDDLAPKTRLKLRDFMAQWLVKVERDMRSATATSYQSVVNKQIVPALGDGWSTV